MGIKAKLESLAIFPPNNEKNVTCVYISEPTPLEEKNFGTIFSVIDIETNDASNQEIISLINEEMTNNYYRSADLDIELAFENSLHLLNRKLQEVVSEMGEDWLKYFNGVIAVIKNNEVHFSQIGSIIILLAQKNKIIKLNENKKYQTPNPLKIFGDIASGQLTPQAAMIFSAESLLDYLSQEKIKKILEENDPTEARRIISDLLSENNNDTNFAAVILKMAPVIMAASSLNEISENSGKSKAISKILDQPVAGDSMTRLVTKEEQTDELLSPSLWPALKKSFSKWKEKIQPVQMKDVYETNQKNITSHVAPTGAQKIWKIIKKISLMLQHLLMQIISGLFFIGRKISNLFKKNQDYGTNTDKLMGKTRGGFNGAINWLKRLSTPKKAFLILLIGIIILFGQSIWRQSQNKSNKQETEQYETSLTTALNKLGEADTKILMNDYISARNLVKEASDLLNNIPKDSKTWKEKGADPQNKLQALNDKVNFVTRISEPTSLVNFSSLNTGDLRNIAKISDYIYAFSQNNEMVYRYDMEKKENSTTISEAGSRKILAQNNSYVTNVLTLFEDQSLAEFNPVLAKYSEVKISFDDANARIKDINLYGSRLYSLDTENNQIYKNNQVNDNFGSEEKWLKDENVDLSNALNIAVDGAIYVLKENGEVIKLASGEKEDWQLAEIMPKVEKATKIFTDKDASNLYLLDPSQKRVVIFEKNGQLKSQYASDKWGDLKDFIVDEKNSKIYLLNGQEVFELEIEL